MRVKLADFGISTKFENSAGTEHTAETGTYRYMAPEVIRHQQYDHKCDVYSYGVLLWEVLHRQVRPHCLGLGPGLGLTLTLTPTLTLTIS